MTNPQTDASRASRIALGRLSGQELYELHALAYRDQNGLVQEPWQGIGKTRQKVFHAMALAIHEHYVNFGAGK